MQINWLAPLQALVRPKNQFALFFVAFFVAKLLHLGSHFSSLPIVLYLLYFPTFLLPDFLLLVGTKLLIFRHNGGQASAFRKCIGGLLAVFTTACSAAQISFYVETGGEIQWMAASRVMGGSGGMGLLLSGLPSMSIAFAVLWAIALIITPKFYDGTERVLDLIGASFRHTLALFKRGPKVVEEHELLIPFDEDQLPSPASYELQDESPKPSDRIASTATAVAVSIITLGSCLIVALLQYVRPTTPPYAHMSGSLPITIIEAALFQPINSEFCLPHPVEVVVFPFERFNNFFKTPESLQWLPQSSNCSRDNGPRPPPWLGHPKQTDREREKDFPGPQHPGPPPFGPGHHRPGPPPPGPPPPGPPPPGPPPPGPPHGPPPDLSHDGFSPRFRHGHGTGFTGTNPCEILQLSNLDASVCQAVAENIKKKKLTIKNVLLLTLESTRKDVFPLIKNNHPYKTLQSSYGHLNVTAELDEKLQGFTNTAAFLSGQSSGFEPNDKKDPKEAWKSAFKDGMGAININGAITQAAYTLKSLLSSHCGVEPLAVDFTEEVSGRIYQPCLPQVFRKMTSVMSKGKDGDRDDTFDKREEEDFRSWPWESTAIQSVTDQFDSQDVLTAQMGFRNIIAESTISDPLSKHYPPKQPWSNYFGYPETETMAYLRDLFVDAKEQQKRLFVSHLTSSPHHPFATPRDWAGKKQYVNKQRWRPEDPLDGYLNTIQYQDDWISKIFAMLHEVGALSETLVVMTGDHGLAFNSLDHSQSAVNNGHISNFAIPLLFVHPDLPRLQVNASTTPLSILPTILDLLLETDSLPEPAAKIAQDILPSYQGNSLIRDLDYKVRVANSPDKMEDAFFQPFHFSAINPGGSLIAISDASTTFRLILPLCASIPLRFTDISTDPHETDPVNAWTMDELSAVLKVRHGPGAVEWAQLASEMGRWWVWNQRAKWGYWGSARETSRGTSEGGGATGRIKKKHWWETR